MKFQKYYCRRQEIGNMKEILDLHGIRHSDVDRLVENLILLHDDWKIICGNSDKMIEIVKQKLDWAYDDHGIAWKFINHNVFESVI